MAKPAAPARDGDSEGQARAALIDQMMAAPIKQPAKITIFGDDAVTGINPAPPTRTSA